MHSGTPDHGLFITVEGFDGAGKSEQARRLAAALTSAGRSVTLTREPGGTPIGERIRASLLDPALDRSAEAEALLFNAARAELVSTIVRPAMERGEVVVCDRYADSTLAYQGYGAGADLGWLRAVQLLATGGLMPRLTILLDIPVGVGLARRARGPAAELSRFEAPTIHDPAFHDRVRDGFLALAAEEPERWRVVDGEGDPEKVARRVFEALGSILVESEPAGHLVRNSP